MEQANNEPAKQNEPVPAISATEQEIKNNLKNYSGVEQEQINTRLQELEKEWDIERSMELNASVMAITGTILGVTINKRWLAVPVCIAALLAQHAIQGWNPLIPLFRKYGFRTHNEIEREKYALKALRGDFKRIGQSHNKAWKAVNS